MAKSTIVFIHGVGVHPDGWSGSAVERLKEDAKAYPGALEVLNEHFEFKEIAYDEVFAEVVSDWRDLSEKLLNSGFPGAPALTDASFTAPLAAAFVDYAQAVQAITAPDKFLSTHAMDAVLYGGFGLVRSVVDHCVAAKLATIVADACSTVDADEFPRIVVVAHSLGTAVAQNAIQLLGTKDWLANVPPLPVDATTQTLAPIRKGQRNKDNPFDPKQTGLPWLSGIVMIANTSPLGVFCKPGPGENQSIVRPKFSGGSRGRVADSYINVSHVYDPICKLALFSTETWGQAHADGYAEDVSVRHIYDKNVHGLNHYLMHPSVHARIFSLARPDHFTADFVSQADARVGSNNPGAFPEISATIKANTKQAMQKKLTELGNKAGGAPSPTITRIKSIYDGLRAVLGKIP